MPDLVRSRLRLAGVGLVCAKVALIPIVFDAASDFPFVVPKALLSHALAYAIAAVLAAMFIRFGRAAALWSPLHIPVLAYLGVASLATIFAVDPYIALFGTHERMLGLATLADWILLYFAVVTLVRTRDEAFTVALSAFGAAVVVLAYEVVQVIGRDPLSWTIEGTDRAFSTTGQPTSLGQYASTVAVATFAAGILAPRLGRVVRIALLALAAALVWGAGATDSRAPVVGLATAALVLVVSIWVSRRGTRDARIAAFAGAASVVTLAALLLFTPIGTRVAFTLQAAGARDESIFSRVDQSTAGRIALYGIAIGEFLERPILGYGPDNFVMGVPRYRPEPAPYAVRQSMATSAHSWLVQTAATTGLLGIVALLACFVVAAALVIRSSFQALPLIAGATLAAHLGTGLTTIDDLTTGWIPWFCLGVIAASTGATVEPSEAPATTARKRGGGRRGVRRESQTRRAVAGVIVVVGVLAMLTMTTAYAASRSAKTSTDARLAGKNAEAIQAGLAAVRDDPRRGEYWHALALAYVGAQRLGDARTAFERANVLTAFIAGYTGDLIQIELILAQGGDAGARTRAVALANALASRDGNNPRSHISRAVTMQFVGDVPEAVRSIERALALDPDSTNHDLYRAAVQIYLAADRPQDAVNVARRGIAALGEQQPLRELRDALDRALAALGLPPDPRPDVGGCTSTRWTAAPFGPVPAGTSVAFTIAAAGCQRQESQIAVMAPGAAAPTFLQGGAWASAFTWDTRGLAAGTYRVLLYTRRVGWAGSYQAFFEGTYQIR